MYGAKLWHSPLVRFQPVNQTTAGDPLYYSFIDAEGTYYLMEHGVAAGTIRYYANRDSVYAHDTAWTNRATLTYSRFDKVVPAILK